VLTVKNLTKSYATPRGPLPILAGISLDVRRGEAVAIMGPSGSGKSTLLYILGALESPTSGSVTLDGQDPFALGEREQAQVVHEALQNVGLLQRHRDLRSIFGVDAIHDAFESSTDDGERRTQLMRDIGKHISAFTVTAFE